VKQAASDLDALAQSIAREVNRVHAGGAGLTEFSTLTAVNARGTSTARTTVTVVERHAVRFSIDPQANTSVAGAPIAIAVTVMGETGLVVGR